MFLGEDEDSINPDQLDPQVDVMTGQVETGSCPTPPAPSATVSGPIQEIDVVDGEGAASGSMFAGTAAGEVGADDIAERDARDSVEMRATSIESRATGATAGSIAAEIPVRQDLSTGITRT